LAASIISQSQEVQGIMIRQIQGDCQGGSETIITNKEGKDWFARKSESQLSAN